MGKPTFLLSMSVIAKRVCPWPACKAIGMPTLSLSMSALAKRVRFVLRKPGRTSGQSGQCMYAVALHVDWVPPCYYVEQKGCAEIT
jgi:hypothetical protein